MARSKRSFGEPFMHDVRIEKEGDNPDCVHHETIVTLVNRSGLLVGTCKKCGQIRHYEDRLYKKIQERNKLKEKEGAKN